MSWWERQYWITHGPLMTAEQEPTGFTDRTATLSWDNATYTLTITGEHSFYYQGQKFTRQTESIQISDVTGLHFIYYDTTQVLTSSQTFPGMDVPLIAFVYWNTTLNKGLVSDERHGVAMDHSTHEYLHTTIGTRYGDGLTGTFGNTTFSITEGSIWDEDLEHEISAQTTCDVLYKDGSADYTWLENQTQYYYSSGGNLYYNNGNTLTVVGANQYIAVWVFATPSITRPIVTLMGQRTDSTLANARANNKYESLTLGTLPFKEMKLLYRVILRNDATPYEETEDLRAVTNVSTGAYVATNHGALTGLNWAAANHTFDTDLDIANNKLVVNTAATFYEDSGGAVVDGTSGFKLRLGGTSQIYSGAATRVDVNSTLRPNATTTHDLGASGYLWNNVYCANLYPTSIPGYAKQTWTPSSYTGNGSMTWTSIAVLEAYYYQIEDMVFIQGRFLGTTGASASNALNVIGLPVIPSSNAVATTCLSCAIYVGGSAYSGTAILTGGTTAANSQIQFVKYDRSNYALTTNTGVQVNGFYRVG